MTGRARGRATRGRSRGTGTLDSARPGEQKARPPSSETQVGPGRGTRGRGTAGGGQQQQQKQQPPPQQQQAPGSQQQQVAAVAESLSSLEVRSKTETPATAATKPATATTATTKTAGRGRGGSEPVTRPEHIQDKSGSTGSAIQVVSNYIKMKSKPNCSLYQYNVSYAPPIENKRLRVALLYSYEAIGPTKAFDGMILYLPHKLPDQVTKFVTKTQRDQTTVEVAITLTNEVPADSPVCLQLFNIIFRRILCNLEMIQIGRHYYYNKKPIPVPAHKLELWPGFVSSILQYEHSILLNLDISHKILRTDTVYDYMNEVYTSGRQQHFHDMVTKVLVGEIVLTRYNNKTYRIDDINFDMNPMTKFKTRDGSEITFVEYYKKTHDIEIYDKQQPLIVSNPKAREVRARGGDDSPFMLVPELCTRTGLSDEARADFRVMKDLGEHTRISPAVRRKRCLDFIRDMKRHPKCATELNGWNLDFENNLVQYNARVVPAEPILMHQSRFNYKPSDADWSREMRGKNLISPVSLQQFMVIATNRDGDKARDFMQTLGKVGPPMGIEVNGRNANMLFLENDRTESFTRSIENNLTRNTQMVIVVLPTNRKDRYDAIKKLCCVSQPVPSQCIMARTLSKKNTLMSVVTKVAMQINCKLGGELWALEIPIKNLMVIGIDTYHDSAKRGRSAMGFVASTNSILTRYYSQCMFQHTGMEMGDNLKVSTSNALTRYMEINKTLPDKIIVYRDGVGDGQLSAVVDHEVAQITSAFANYKGYAPKFTVVVVKKRINTRIFHNVRGDLMNPPPGTVVDDVVTKPEWYDFFVVSQSVRQGTVTPTHFNVICDTSGLKPDHMQRLTYKLCHLYYNWPGTVRVPAPCQYAHKLAFLVGQSIHKEPSKYLADKLYYL